jgi:6-phosphogluconolactonase
MPRPFAAVVSGVGEDGHFASLFPGVAATPGGLDLSRPQSCIAIDAPQAGHPRLSLTLRAMLDCPRVRVIVTGAAKREVLEKATAMKDASLPVSLLLAQEQTPVDVYWAP